VLTVSYSSSFLGVTHLVASLATLRCSVDKAHLCCQQMPERTAMLVCPDELPTTTANAAMLVTAPRVAICCKHLANAVAMLALLGQMHARSNHVSCGN